MRKIEHPGSTFARTSAAQPRYVLPLANSLAVGASCAKHSQHPIV
jgi:hypothetical protein